MARGQARSFYRLSLVLIEPRQRWKAIGRSRSRSAVAEERRIGIDQLTFDFRTGRVDEMLAIVEHFATAVMTTVQGIADPPAVHLQEKE